jgi:hypothetical protein
MTDDEKQMAVDAKRFLEDPICARTLEAVTRAYRKQLEESEFDDRELREHCYLLLKSVREFHRQLTQLAVKGKLETMRQARGGNRSAL